MLISSRGRNRLTQGTWGQSLVRIPILWAVLFSIGNAPAAEQSVNPGINKSFLAPDLKVGAFVERFEREGREVYDHREAIVAKAALGKGKTVADIGAGTGLFTPYLSAAVGPKGTVIAVDIVPKFLSHIENRARELKLKNISTVLCTAKSSRLKPGSVDLVFICDTYHHFEYPQSTLQSIHKALRPGGAAIIKVPNYASVNRRVMGDRWCGFRFPGHVNYFTPQSLRDMVEAAGFRVDRFGLFDRFYLSDNMWMVASKPA